MGIETILLATALAVGTASSIKAAKDRKSAERAAAERAKKAEELRKRMASQVTAPQIKEGADVQLESGEAAEEAEILRRGKRSRLKVSKGGAVGGLQGSGTGLQVG